MSESVKSKIENFYNNDHINNWMGKIDRWNQQGFCGKLKARGGNAVTLSMDFAGFFLNFGAAPVVAAAQPTAALVYGGAAATGSIVRLTKLDRNTPQSASRRKVMNVLPKIKKYTPGIVAFGRTLRNIVIFAAAFFTSLTIGFIFVSANIWVHHKLGLICNPELAKKDRINSVLDYARKLEGSSLENKYKGNLKKQIEKRAELILKKQKFGDNKYEPHEETIFIGSMIQRGIADLKESLGKQKLTDEEIKTQESRKVTVSCLVLAEDSLLKTEIEEATTKKRANALADLALKRGAPLSEEEKKQIEVKYWRKLSDFFPFEINDQVEPHYRKFLNKFFHWKSDIIEPNIQDPKAKPIIIDTIFHKQPFFKSPKHYQDYMAIFYKWNLTEEEVKAVIAAISIPKEQKTAAYVQAENEIYAEKREIEKTALEALSSSAWETEQQKEKTLLDAAQDHKSLKMPIKHYYELKNCVLRQLPCEKPLDPTFYDLDADVNVDKEILAKVDVKFEELMEKEVRLKRESRVQQKIKKMEKEIGKQLSQDKIEEIRLQPEHDIESELIEQIRDEHYRIERPRLYAQLLLERMFPAGDDIRKFRKSDKEERTLPYEALEKAREIAFQYTGKPLVFHADKDIQYSYLDGLYTFDEDKGKIERRTKITYAVWRKSNDKNIPIDKIAQLANKVASKACAFITLEIDRDNFVNRITIEERKVRNADGTYKIPNTTDFTYSDDVPKTEKTFTNFDELYEVKVLEKPWHHETLKARNETLDRPKMATDGRVLAIKHFKKIFEEAAKEYKQLEVRIGANYERPLPITKLNGITKDLENLKQKGQIMDPYVHFRFWDSIDRLLTRGEEQKEQLHELQTDLAAVTTP